MPNTLQKWHVASKALEQNQTNIYNKLQQMRTNLSSYEKEVYAEKIMLQFFYKFIISNSQLTVVREQINKKDGTSSKDQLTILQTNMADFGAKMKDLSINVASLKEHLQLLQQTDNKNRKNLAQLTVSVIEMCEEFMTNKQGKLNFIIFKL